MTGKLKLQDLSDFFKEHGPTCVHAPSGMLKYRFVTPSYAVKAGADDTAQVAERSTTGHYLQMYDWDACFFSQAAHQIGIEDLPLDVVANFLTLKRPDGHIPRTVSPQRVWDAGDQCKPFLTQTVLKAIGGRAQELIPKLLDDLDCYLRYFERERKSQWGLYKWRNVLESGVDDNLALIAPREAAKDEDDSIGRFPDGEILAVDLSIYLAKEFASFAQLAKRYKREDAGKYRDMADQVIAAVEEHLWCDKTGIYLNYNPVDKCLVPVKSWTSLAPVIMGLAPESRAHRVIKDYMINPDHFLAPCGIASHDLAEPLANQQRRGLYGRAIVSNWQGPVWILTNALCVRALKHYGFTKEARDVSERVCRTLIDSIANTGTLYENYDAISGKPLWAPQFMSWNILALELIETLA